jgi:hypothetical protein
MEKNILLTTKRRKTKWIGYEQQWAPNTIQTIIMICNAKGIPNAIAQKLRDKTEKQ